MAVHPPKPNALLDIFGSVPRVIVGVIHSKPLPGSPRYSGTPLDEVYQFAVDEALRYERGGVHGLIVENAWDLPFDKPDEIGLETAATMSVLAARVRETVRLPLGVNILANGVMCAVAIAKAVDAPFVRANQWVNAYIANEGFVEGAAPRATRYRSWLHAHDVAVFADVHVKHGSHAIVGDRSLAEQVRDAEFFDADVLIATGQRTGNATKIDELAAVKQAAHLPVLIGSGLSAANARELLSMADGAIVASSVKKDGLWWNPVSVERVKNLMATVDGL